MSEYCTTSMCAPHYVLMKSVLLPLDSPVYTLGVAAFYIVRGLTLGSLYSEVIITDKCSTCHGLYFCTAFRMTNNVYFNLKFDTEYF